MNSGARQEPPNLPSRKRPSNSLQTGIFGTQVWTRSVLPIPPISRRRRIARRRVVWCWTRKSEIFTSGKCVTCAIPLFHSIPLVLPFACLLVDPTANPPRVRYTSPSFVRSWMYDTCICAISRCSVLFPPSSITSLPPYDISATSRRCAYCARHLSPLFHPYILSFLSFIFYHPLPLYQSASRFTGFTIIVL